MSHKLWQEIRNRLVIQNPDTRKLLESSSRLALTAAFVGIKLKFPQIPIHDQALDMVFDSLSSKLVPSDVRFAEVPDKQFEHMYVEGNDTFGAAATVKLASQAYTDGKYVGGRIIKALDSMDKTFTQERKQFEKHREIQKAMLAFDVGAPSV